MGISNTKVIVYLNRSFLHSMSAGMKGLGTTGFIGNHHKKYVNSEIFLVFG